jgi:L-lactate utilization protein LutB
VFIPVNEALAAVGIRAHETDLAELIVQLGRDWPSHILVPAIHRNRAEIREIFLREMGDVNPGLTDDPAALADAARRYLRRRFLSARVGISGANFAVAETGALGVVESEGLHCIRCSACLNVCPVYERVGGHAYGSIYPGPIGAILSPQLTGIEDNGSLPYASSLCGACYDVCPVKIDIPSVLVHLRARHVGAARHAHRLPGPEAITMAAASWVMADPGRFATAQRAAKLGRALGRGGRIRTLPPPLSGWTEARDMPVPAAMTFREWWRHEHSREDGARG